MSALTSDFAGNTVFIYDANGNHLNNTIVSDYDKDTHQIQVDEMPGELKINDTCKILILSSPAPCEFKGRVKKTGGQTFIAMYMGQEKESRNATRYPVNTPALVTAFIIDGTVHSLQSPVKVTVINISTNGMRFSAPYYSFDNDDKIQMHMIINSNRKMITATVIDHNDKENNITEYGCQFLGVE